jgi:very-short-patch-repair endonuclease
MRQFRPRPTNRAQQLRNNATDAERRLWQHLNRRHSKASNSHGRFQLVPSFVISFAENRG